jgi:hypothetical protein
MPSVEFPDFDPSGSAAAAMQQYDTDGDGYVAGAELKQAPSLNATLKGLDTDNDGRVSASEIEARIQAWVDMKTGLVSFPAEFVMDGRPLVGATVTFDPEEFLGGVVSLAEGTVAITGLVKPRVPKELRPRPDSPPGVQAGFYKVRVSRVVKGKETIPAKYNTETTLGQEVSKDNWAIENKQVRFTLTNK